MRTMEEIGREINPKLFERKTYPVSRRPEIPKSERVESKNRQTYREKKEEITKMKFEERKKDYEKKRALKKYKESIRGRLAKDLQKTMEHRLSYKKGKRLPRATLRLKSRVQPEPYRSIFFR